MGYPTQLFFNRSNNKLRPAVTLQDHYPALVKDHQLTSHAKHGSMNENSHYNNKMNYVGPNTSHSLGDAAKGYCVKKTDKLHDVTSNLSFEFTAKFRNNGNNVGDDRPLSLS